MTEPQKQGGGLSPARRRMVLASGILILALAFGLVIYRLFTIQIRDYAQYKVMAVEQQVSDTTIPAARGSIYDSNGKTLARSTIAWNVTTDPSLTDEEVASEAADKIAEILGTDRETIYQKLTATNKYQTLATKVDKPTADAVKEYATQLNTEYGRTVLYIALEQSSVREYPYGAYLSTVLGFCNDEGGAYGLEKYYEDALSGTDGRALTEENAQGYEMGGTENQVYAPVDGYSLHLTIDTYIQSVVQNYLDAAVERYNVQNRACAIVMDVNTGAVMAMATSDNFDPNEPYTLQEDVFTTALETEGELSAEQIASLKNRLGTKNVEEILADSIIGTDEYNTLQGMMREAQWKNKAITELYSPGSIYKVITSAAGLDSGLLTTASSFFCPGYIQVADYTYRCADYESKGTNHGWQDMAGALGHSCNVYFIQAAQTMDAEVLYDYFEAFGFTETTGIDLPYETPWMSYYTAEEMGPTELASTAFGQSQSVTPIQLCTAIAAAVNGGYLVTPYVVDYITDSTGNVVQTTETTIKRQVISQEVSDQIRTMMNQVMDVGGVNAKVPGYQMGGKSGTTEQLNQDKREDGDYKKVSSFVAVLPINDPEILVYVMLDDPRSINDYASQIVAPVGGNIVSEIAPYLGLETDPNTVITGNVRVPYLINHDTSASQATLNQSGLEHQVVGSGTTVLAQYPEAGMTAPAGSTVYLYTESEEQEMVEVPDVVGKTATAANQLLSAAGLNPGNSNGSQVVQSQYPTAGSQVPKGAVVTLEVVDTTTGE